MFGRRGDSVGDVGEADVSRDPAVSGPAFGGSAHAARSSATAAPRKSQRDESRGAIRILEKSALNFSFRRSRINLITSW